MRNSPEKYTERELPTGRPILTTLPNGKWNPESAGWSRQPVQVSNLMGHWPRKKRWNYWCVVSSDFLFSVTLSNVDYMGLAFTYFLDFKTMAFIEQTVMSPFGRGCGLPDTVEGQVDFKNKDMALSFSDRGREIDLWMQSPNFQGEKLEARLHLERPAELESLNVMIPWNADQYHFTSKQNCLPAGGTVRVGEKAYTLDAARDFGCLDFGRGMWKYATFWNWSSFSTQVGADLVGINLGAGWTDGSGATENSLLIDGKVEKISEDVVFKYDPQHFMNPWRLKTTFSNQVDLTFTPFYERIAKTDFLVLKSEAHQMIGKFNGTLTSQDGRKFAIADVIGWAEEHNARW